MSQQTIITKNHHGGYNVITKTNDDPLSALVWTPSYASTLWGARRLARKHQKWSAKSIDGANFREVVK